MLKTIVAAGLWLLTAAAAAGDAPTCPAFPQAHPNMVKLRALVCGTDVEAVERYFDERQRLYETGKHDDSMLLWAYNAFNQPYDSTRIADWLRRYPKSHAAHVASAVDHHNR